MFSRRNFSSDEFLSFSLSSVLQYASARLLLIFQRPFSSRFYRLWLKNLYRETAKQLVVKRLSSTMRRKCACSRFNGIDWVWSKSPFGQIISTHFRFRRPVPIPDEGISRGKKEKEKKKKRKEEPDFVSWSSIRNSILVKKGYKAVDELTRLAKSVLI